MVETLEHMLADVSGSWQIVPSPVQAADFVLLSFAVLFSLGFEFVH